MSRNQEGRKSRGDPKAQCRSCMPTVALARPILNFFIELFGIPGAGKSAYRTQLTEELRAGGIEVADPGSMARTKGRYTQQLRGVTTTLSRLGLGVRNRRVLWWCLSVLRRSPRPFSQKIAAFRFVFVTLERYAEYHGDVSDRVYIMDEGSLQRLFLLLVERDGVQAEVLSALRINMS